MILENVRISFDPEKDETLKKVFADDLARQLFLSVAPSHLTSNTFGTDCLAYAANIRYAKKKGPITAGELLRILSGIAAPPGHGIIGPAEQAFAEELLPFVNGEKTITYSVEVKRPDEERDFQQRLKAVSEGLH